MVATPILVFPDWMNDFHVHVNASLVALGVILEHPWERKIDHTIAFAIRKLPTIEIN